ncbi:MAG TPA: cytochrome c [Thermoanaerobaculia bacterium]|nr:cytochrome c [Thermoanaerobaculia bacterium]
MINLAQGWSEQQQEWFWFTSQGSRLLPYDWFLALEQAGGTEPFRSDAHMDQLRYLLEKPSPANPDGLPVGFAKDIDPATGQAWMGLTCAACHTNQIDYKGTGIRIDGAPTLADAFRFFDELAAAMEETGTDDAKFERFARKVLGQGYDQESAERLRQDLRDAADVLAVRQRGDRPEHPYGPGRLDAFGAIFNQVLAADLGVPENRLPANAPVSYPFLWDTPQSDLVQWNGSAPNAGAGPLARNTGEILGVFGTVSVQPGSGLNGYPSSANIKALGDLEETLDDLWSPLWPAEILPAIDQAKAGQGQAIFQQHCASCHALIDRTDPNRRITAVMTPVDELGTDPIMADNFLKRAGRTGPLQGHKVFIVMGSTFGTEAPGIDILENVVVGTILGHKIQALEAGIHEYLKVKKAATFDPRSYKARSLNGIWATAPYLHNGSVPNLWQLLQPEEQRVKRFYVGSRELDPINVGFDTAPYPGGFEFDTTLPGNSNAGHTWGTTLPDDQKWALIEYLKSL